MSITMNVNRLNTILFPDGDVKSVKSAGVWVIAKEPKSSSYQILMGEMVKNNPDKKETHIFHKTYSGFSGKSKPNETPIETAVREFQEETHGIFGNDSDMLALIATDSTSVLKNMGWSKYPVATYVVEVEFSDEYIEAFNRLRSDTSELQRLTWIPLSQIWNSIDTYTIKDTMMTWGEYNSADNLRSLFGPLNGLYSGVELELEKNKLKHNLPVVAYDGTTIEIADYVARTFMEYREDLEKMFPL
jgi:8-oxo-dGTP pyrophosphatase MutT (NUDIX family)